jgi:predicted transcriptional regulator
MQVTLNTRVPIEIAKALDNYAQASGKSKAAIVAAALQKYLARHKLPEKEAPKMFKAIIADGAARKEGRDPNHDGEYLTLYWNPAKQEFNRPQWILQHNAGVCATCYQDYEETCAENNFGLTEYTEAEMDAAIAEAKQIQYEIYEIIRGSGSGDPIDPERMGNEAQDLAVQWGWFSPLQEI